MLRNIAGILPLLASSCGRVRDSRNSLPTNAPSSMHFFEWKLKRTEFGDDWCFVNFISLISYLFPCVDSRHIILVLHAHPFKIRIQLDYFSHFLRTGLRAPAPVRPGAPVRHQLRTQPLEVREVVPEKEVVRAVGPPPTVKGHHFAVAREAHEVVAASRRHPRRVSWRGQKRRCHLPNHFRNPVPCILLPCS